MDFWINTNTNHRDTRGDTRASSDQLVVGGEWTIDHLVEIDRTVNELATAQSATRLSDLSGVNASQITQLDTSGAMLLLRLARACRSSGITGLSPVSNALLQRIAHITPASG